jgi:hypothetical protein
MMLPGQITACDPPPELLCDEPDAHLILTGSNGDLAARCSLWWRSTPVRAGEHIGAIGHFSANDAENGARLLLAACAQLAARGCKLAVGPMDGNTWRRYRLIIDRGDEPPFFLEPDTPAYWPECFARAKFLTSATYCSSVQDDLEWRDNRIHAVATRAANAGINIRTIDMRDPERDLVAMHALALHAFSNSFLFSPIGKSEFLARYSRLLPHVRPELVQVAEHRGNLVAFLFAVPDALESTRGAMPSTVILKTVAVRSGRIYAGLPHLMAARGATAAAGLGYRRAVHALMHNANSSLNWSALYGRVFRRYAVLERFL